MSTWKKVSEFTVNVGPEKFLVTVEPINPTEIDIVTRLAAKGAERVAEQIALVPDLVDVVSMFLKVADGENDFAAADVVPVARKVLRLFRGVPTVGVRKS